MASDSSSRAAITPEAFSEASRQAAIWVDLIRRAWICASREQPGAPGEAAAEVTEIVASIGEQYRAVQEIFLNVRDDLNLIHPAPVDIKAGNMSESNGHFAAVAYAGQFYFGLWYTLDPKGCEPAVRSGEWVQFDLALITKGWAAASKFISSYPQPDPRIATYINWERPRVVDLLNRRGQQAAGELSELVTLDQVAPLLGVSKRSMERYLKDGKLPAPDIAGGSGRAHKWYWHNLRPALSEVSRLQFPEVFPGSRII